MLHESLISYSQAREDPYCITHISELFSMHEYCAAEEKIATMQYAALERLLALTE